VTTAADPEGRVAALARYPVKSTTGEELAEVLVDERGCAGDRLWSVRDPDGRLGSGKTNRRFRRMDGLLELVGTYDGDMPVIGFPDGRRLRGDEAGVDEALSRHVGRPVSLAREDDVSHFDEGPLHLVTTTSLATLARARGGPVDWRHTRANLLVETTGHGFPEQAWVGRRLRVGPEVVLRVRGLMPRCVMVDAAQDGLPGDPGLLRVITEVSAGTLGVWADVEVAGRLRVGDDVGLGQDPV
jgi:uncharacterized protein